MKKYKYNINNLYCAGCAKELENALNKTQTIKFIDSQGLESKKQRFYEIIEEKNC